MIRKGGGDGLVKNPRNYTVGRSFVGFSMLKS